MPAALQKLDKLRGSLHFLASKAPAERRHTLFADRTEEAAELSTHPHAEQHQALQPEQEPTAETSRLDAAVTRRQAGAYTELRERAERHHKLQRLAQRSTLTRNLMVTPRLGWGCCALLRQSSSLRLLQGRGSKSKHIARDPGSVSASASFQWKPARQR